MVDSKYRAVKDGKSWSVIDARTRDVVTYSGVVLAGLSESVAKDLAELLNLKHPDDRPPTPLPR